MAFILNMKKALIFGITGQDGSYLAEFFKKLYCVRCNTNPLHLTPHVLIIFMKILSKLNLIYGSCDSSNVKILLEIY